MLRLRRTHSIIDSHGFVLSSVRYEYAANLRLGDGQRLVHAFW
jgi:hypothetical protein